MLQLELNNIKSRFRYHIFLGIIRYGIFFVFFFHCSRTIYVYLSYIPQNFLLIAVPLVVIGLFFSMLTMKGSLFLFIALIPFVSGIKTIGYLQSAPILSFLFSIIFISWFLKRIFYTKGTIQPNNQIGNIIDVLSGIIFLSVLISFSRYPIDFILYRIKYASTLGQSDPFWFIDASFIFLQGLFFYRILDLEIKNNREWKLFIRCFYIHALVITIFSLVQLFFNIPVQKKWGNSIHSPFMDIHAYGGYVVLLFFFFLSLISKNLKKYRISLILTLILFCFIILSGSSSTLISMVIFGIAYSVFKLEKRSFLTIIGFVMIILICFSVFSSKIKIDKKSSIKRYSDRLSLDGAMSRLGGRFSSWDQAIGIIKEFPITGSGIGTYYKVSRYYHFSDKDQFIRHENAHNYYIQFAADLGIPALIMFLLILGVQYYKSIQYISTNLKDKKIVTGLLFGLSAYLLTMMTSHHLIGSNHQFLFWFILFVLSFHTKFTFQVKKLSIILFILFFLVVAGHAFNLFYFQKKVRGPYEYGFYEKEKIEKRSVRWTMKMSGSKEFAETDIIGIRFYAMPDKVSEENLGLDIFINNTQIDRVYVKESGFKRFYYYIPGIKNNEYLLRIKVSKTFNPYKLGLIRNIKHSRDQGIAWEKVRYLTKLPKKYKKIGFVVN